MQSSLPDLPPPQTVPQIINDVLSIGGLVGGRIVVKLAEAQFFHLVVKTSSGIFLRCSFNSNALA